MQILLRGDEHGSVPKVFPRFLWSCRLGLAIACVAILTFPAAAGNGQQGAAQVTPRPIIIPNRALDTHDLNDMAERNARKRNFEAANLARKLLIDDETNRLVILARDMKKRTDQLGDNPLPPVLQKEAAVIEFLANDVKEKMKLIVSVE